jgi:sugar-specific transcriptional regulator TrmB
MDIGTLEKIGLSANEARVYLALLELGPSLAGKVTEMSKVNRRTVYDVLESLIDKGLVSYVIEANRKVFEATNPVRFCELLKERESEIRAALPELQAKREAARKRQEAAVFRGKKGIRTIFEDILKYRENLVFGSHGRFKDVMGPFFKQYQRRKKSLNINTKLLLSERLRKSDIVKSTPGEHRFLKKEYDSPVSTIIYGDKTAIIIWADEPIGFVVAGKEVASSFQNYFKIMWEMAKA